MDIYDRDGNRITAEQYAKLLRDNNDYKRIVETRVHNLRVSTVWLGFDHGFLDHGLPLIFETMVFGDTWSELGEFTRRYSTENEAHIGHELVVEEIKQLFSKVTEVEEG